MEHTAAGTVTDSHRVPFYPFEEISGIPFPAAKVIKNLQANNAFFKKIEHFLKFGMVVI